METSKPVPNNNNNNNDDQHHRDVKRPFPRDPRTWSVSDVSDWLRSKNVAEYIVQAFIAEGVAGDILMDLSKEDMAAIGVRVFSERYVIAKSIQELKDEWMIIDARGSGGVPHSAGGAIIHNSVRTEDGKGAPPTDAPPSYSHV
jgi:hypothetical protein